MKAAETIVLGAGAVLLYTLISKKAAAGKLNFFPASVKNIHFDGPTPVMTIGLAVQNTSNQQFVIRSIAGNLIADGYLVGNLSHFNEQVINPNAQGVLNLDIRLSLIGIVNDIIRVFQQRNFSMELKLDAYANVDNYQVPLVMTYKIGL